MEADGPLPERKLELDKPEATFGKANYLDKYPEAVALLNADPTMTVRQLEKLAGVGHGTAGEIRKAWQAARPKEEQSAEKQAFFGKGKTLSKAEVEDYNESFPAAVEDFFQAFDKWGWNRQKAVGIDSDDRPNWTAYDQKEMDRLNKIAMRWGQKNGVAATVVRGTVEGSDYVALISFFLPRIQESMRIYRETKQERPKRRGRQHAQDYGHD